MRTLALTLALAATAHAADWPGFRGPNGSAVAEDSQLPAEWGKDKNVAWKVALPGYGWSCPVVWGDKVFVTTAVSDKQRKPAAGFGGGPGRGRRVRRAAGRRAGSAGRSRRTTCTSSRSSA